MKYTFNFTEINHGSVTIESKTRPSESDVVDAIHSGNAFYKNTEYEDIEYCGSERSKSDRDCGLER